MFEPASGPFLPPLTEKIDRGSGPGSEFERLMNQLLLVDAARHDKLYQPMGGSGDGGVDGLAPKGIPGLEGPVAFQFKWLWEDIHKGSKAQQITDWLARAAMTQSERGIKHWILVTPKELNAAERDWLTSQAEQSGLSVHSWGQAQIERLLRDCPALMARYYPASARLEDFDGTDFREFARTYRERVAIAFEGLKTIGMPPETLRERDSRALHLRDLFIPLHLVQEGPDKAPQKLARVLTEGNSVVVLGDPGMGKEE